MPQLPLFAETPAKPIVTDSQRALAEKLPPRIRLGTMSWNFPGWIGLVFDARTKASTLSQKGLAPYAQHPLFRTVEIDRTYYSPIDAAAFAVYAAQTPSDFRFAVKAHADCTSIYVPQSPRFGQRRGQRNMHLLDVAYTIDMVIAPFVEGLHEKCGPLVFQFPPQEIRSPARFAEKLHYFLDRLPKGPSYAVELRNEELLTPQYAEVIAATGALHCYNAWARMPSVQKQAAFLPPRGTVLVRWLLQPGDKYEDAKARYQPFDKLVDEDLTTRQSIASFVAASAEAFVLVNNKAEGSAPCSIFALAEATFSALRR